MPRGDRRGPMGEGPGTGRAAGYCSGFDRPGYANPQPGRGFGMGFGMGRGGGWGRGGGGWGRGGGWARSGGWAFGQHLGRGGRRWGRWMPWNWFGGPAREPYGPQELWPAPEDERRFLEDDVTALRGQLKAMERRLRELQKKSETPEQEAE